MAALFRSVRQFGKSLIFSESNRNISLSATTRLREIIEKKEDNVLTIEAVKVPQTKENLLVKIDSHACPLCATELDVKHTDVLILSQFLRSNGTMLPRRITKLCNVQQKRVSVLVIMAQRAGLLPNRFAKRNKTGSMSQENSRRRRFNTYYDEDTIKYKYWR
ncbi:39S ribosomal protein S18a, mitochondrial [Temnothorax curvispinosus]|uniref:39S ribosomal protein S18a, mitochondrial n=1 Tax=Temnothorax curvispinosus TaxID=300111 RepID=A0A6J1RF03_9HYME|nr:39S ribosomal protein S18a, mitochondrial [Temnothorax curvispinosus]